MDPFERLPAGKEPHRTRYINFIKSRPDHGKRSKDNYLERHHILPRLMDGTNEKANIIWLTTREHFIAHLILWKCYGGSMAQAFYYMQHKNVSSGKHNRVLSARQFEKLFSDSRKYNEIRSKEIWQNPSRLDKVHQYEKTDVAKKAHKRQGTSLRQSFIDRPELREARSLLSKGENNGMWGRHDAHTEEGLISIAKATGERQSRSRWMTRGSESVSAAPERWDCLLAEGWVFGRPKGQWATTKGSKWMYKGNVCEMI